MIFMVDVKWIVVIDILDLRKYDMIFLKLVSFDYKLVSVIKLLFL